MSTILFLASDPAIRMVICNLLESEGYCALAASDVGSAVDRLKELTPDLLMVRHYTQSLSGHEAAMYLRRMCPGIPVLLVGGILDDVDLENREVLQGFEIFPKPFKAAELLDKVKEVLVKCSARNTADRNSEQWLEFSGGRQPPTRTLKSQIRATDGLIYFYLSVCLARLEGFGACHERVGGAIGGHFIDANDQLIGPLVIPPEARPHAALPMRCAMREQT